MTGGGVAWIAVVTAVVAGRDIASREDAYRASSATMLLVGGLVLALALGATAVARGGESGHLGLLVASGASRTSVTAGRLVGRVGALGIALASWCLMLQAGSAALGRGLDGPLAVHVAAAAETYLVVLLAAAAVSTVLGPLVSGFAGVVVYVGAQAVVNMEAAADQGRLGAWSRVAHVAYNTFPRAVLSPMIVELQNRGDGGVSAPRFEINEIVVPLPAAGATTVAFTAFWCALLGLLCVAGMRRRTL